MQILFALIQRLISMQWLALLVLGYSGDLYYKTSPVFVWFKQGMLNGLLFKLWLNNRLFVYSCPGLNNELVKALYLMVMYFYVQYSDPHCIS